MRRQPPHHHACWNARHALCVAKDPRSEGEFRARSVCCSSRTRWNLSGNRGATAAWPRRCKPAGPVDARIQKRCAWYADNMVYTVWRRVSCPHMLQSFTLWVLVPARQCQCRSGLLAVCRSTGPAEGHATSSHTHMNTHARNTQDPQAVCMHDCGQSTRTRFRALA